MKKFAILAIIVVAVVLLWTGGWFFAAAQVRDGMVRLASPQSPAEPRVTCGNLDIGGFPFRFDIACADANLSRGDIVVTLPRLRATALVYSPTHYLIFADGPAQIEDAFTGSQYEIGWSELKASARFDWTKLKRISLQWTDPKVTDRLTGGGELMAAKALELHLLDAPAQEGAGTDLQTITVAGRLAGYAFAGAAIADANVELDAMVSGLDPDVLVWANDPAYLRRWQQNGGKIEIENFRLTAPDLSASLSGTLTPDETGAFDGQLAMVEKGVTERAQPYLPPEINMIVASLPAGPEGRRIGLGVNKGVVGIGPLPLFMLPRLPLQQ